MSSSRQNERHEQDNRREQAARISAWAGEPLLRVDDDPEIALAAGSARRRALDEGLHELDAGLREPSSAWRARYGLMLGLERVLADEQPRLASGTTLRRHQADALAGLLSELLVRNQEPEVLPDEEVSELELEELENGENGDLDVEGEVEEEPLADPGARDRFRFRHPTASGKTFAAAGFVEAGRTLGVLILTHRRLLIDQFKRDLSQEGYRERLTPTILKGVPGPRSPLTIQTYAWFTRHQQEIDPDAYQLVICDEAHTALGTKTSAAIRSFQGPIFVGMTATEELLAKHVSEVFPASVDDLPLKDASRRGLVAPLRCLRVPPVAAINSVPIIGGDFDQGQLAKTLDHQALNQAAASLYRERFGSTPGIVYAAGVEHAYNLAVEFRAVGLKAEAVSGKTSPLRLAETLAAYERGEIDVLINAMLLAEGWNSPRATVCMHLAPTASKRVYQQRVGRVMRLHPRKEAGVVVDFVPKAATHAERVQSLHSLLDADFYRAGARVTPAPHRRRRARPQLRPAAWLVPVASEPARRRRVLADEWQRIDPRLLGEDEQKLWAEVAGRLVRPQDRSQLLERLTSVGSRAALEQFLATCAAENPERSLRLAALKERVSLPVEGSLFDDLISLVGQSPPWERDRVQGASILLGALAAQTPKAHPQVLERWCWQLATLVRKELDRRAVSQLPEAKRLLGALANSRGRLHEQGMSRLVKAALKLGLPLGASLLGAAEGYTPQAKTLLERGRAQLGELSEVAQALAVELPQPQPKRRKRRRSKKRGSGQQSVPGSSAGEGAKTRAKTRPRRRPRKGPDASAAPSAG